jgi:hypothetical protein
MKYLFLDIDGVLNTGCYQDLLMKSEQDIIDEDGALFNPIAIENLKYIVEKTSAKIVLTSTWRMDGIEAMREMWERRRMPSYIYGITPHSITRFADIDTHNEWFKHAICSRGMEVNEWLQRNSKGTNAYAIIDDEDDFLFFQAKHVALTNPYDGLTKEIADMVIQILLATDNSVRKGIII